MIACCPKRLLIGEDRDQEQNYSYFKGNRALNKHTSPGLNLAGIFDILWVWSHDRKEVKIKERFEVGLELEYLHLELEYFSMNVSLINFNWDNMGQMYISRCTKKAENSMHFF